MSQLNVDTLGGQTGTTISIASGHTLAGVGGLVKVGSVTASDSATVSIDKIVAHNLLPSVNDREARVKFRTGGASGSDINATYYRAGYYAYASTSGTGSSSNTSYTNYGTFTGAIGNVAGEGISFTGIISAATGSAGTNWIEMNWVYKNDNEHMVKDNQTISIKETTAMTGIKFYFNTGNVASGTIDIYGFAK